MAEQFELGVSVAPSVTVPESDLDAPPTAREVFGWHAEMLGSLLAARPVGRPRRRQRRLIESLNEVAAAISSARSTPDVLSTVVDETKRLLGTDKAVLCLLTDGDGELEIDDRSVFVRGRRDRYPETWWRAKVHDAATSAMRQRLPVNTMSDGVRLMTVPVKTKGYPIGVLAVMNPARRPFNADQEALLAILGAFAGATIENGRLHTQTQYSLLADERNRIAREMHDGLSQSLFSSSLELDVCRKRISEHPEEVAKRLDHVQSVLVRSLGELRRYIYDLRPVSLSTLGLLGAIDQRAHEIGEAHGLSIRVYSEGQTRPLPPAAEACLYRIAQEAVSNAAKHARGQHSVVVLRFETDEVALTIEDDGCGFDLAEAKARVQRDECIGLKSMRERAESAGGKLTISSGQRGTTVRTVLPW